MNVSEAIDSLKNYILQKFEETTKTIHPNLHRGHLRALSTEIEDGIAAFLLNILPEGYRAFVDASVHIGRKTHRPDILIIDNNDCVKALIEVKTNMGWCRNATAEIDKILFKHGEMLSKGNIVCKFSHDETATVAYETNVPVFLVAFTSDNCNLKMHNNNKTIAIGKNVKYYCLFSGWYSSVLNEAGIIEFAKEIKSIAP